MKSRMPKVNEIVSFFFLFLLCKKVNDGCLFKNYPLNLKLFYAFILVGMTGSRVSVDHFSINLGREDTL